jgi:polysaccharide pyruvyl transferase WcaK-like protein
VRYHEATATRGATRVRRRPSGSWKDLTVIVVLSGAKKNIGDFLISDRVTKLVEHVTGEVVRRLPNWEPLDDKTDVLDQADAIVVAGGPGYRPDMYGGVYPLMSTAEKLAALGKPVTFIGLGWKGDPGDDFDLAHYRFNDRTKHLIDVLGPLGRYSARDDLSQAVLVANDVPGALMTGCPAWYDLRSMGRPFEPPAEIQRIVFTPPEQVAFHEQSRTLLASLVRAYPHAEIVCAFHRGIEADEHTTPEMASRLLDYAEYARSLGVDARDVSYDLERISFYREFDLHVGYRLHAHLFFLSDRTPSIILEEDGRGRGAAEVLGTPGIRAWELTPAGRVVRMLNSPKALAAVRRAHRPIKRALADVSEQTLDAIETERKAGFPSFAEATRRIEATYPVMERFCAGILG